MYLRHFSRMHLRVGGNKLIATPLAEERERESWDATKELDAESFRERDRERERQI